MDVECSEGKVIEGGIELNYFLKLNKYEMFHLK